MDLHPGEQIIFEGRPSWRSILQFYLLGLVLAVAAGVIAGLAGSTGLGVGVGIAVLAVVVLAGFLRRLGTRYGVTTERLRIRRGLLSKHVQETRLERVQNVNTDQSVFQRMLRIGTVDFDTAGTTDSDFAFTGVARPERVVAAVDRANRAQSVPPSSPTEPASPEGGAPGATAE
jgi:uncharacterized membrane protein YdbT with pleckstrin-like domain